MRFDRVICGGVLLSLDIILFLPLYHAHLLAPSPLSPPSFSPRLEATAYLPVLWSKSES